jgi:hypothetical protein
MDPSTASQTPGSVPRRTNSTETGSTQGNRHFESTKLPSLGGTGPILPEWLRKLFRRKDTPAAN